MYTYLPVRPRHVHSLHMPANTTAIRTPTLRFFNLRANRKFVCMFTIQRPGQRLRYSDILRDGRFGVLIPAEESFSGSPHLASLSTGPTLKQIPRIFFERKKLRRGIYHPPPSSVEIQSGWSYTSIPSLYLRGILQEQLRLFIRHTILLQKSISTRTFRTVVDIASLNYTDSDDHHIFQDGTA